MKRFVLISAFAVFSLLSATAQQASLKLPAGSFNPEDLPGDRFVDELFYSRFTGDPTFRIKIEPGMLSVHPGKLIPYSDAGYLYPLEKVNSDWGRLNAGGYVLFSKDWKYIILSAPVKIDGNRIKGDEWSIYLREGYYILNDQRDNNFYIIKGKR